MEEMPIMYTIVVIISLAVSAVAIVQFGRVVTRERSSDGARCVMRGRCLGMAAVVCSSVQRRAGDCTASASVADESLMDALEASGAHLRRGSVVVLFDDSGAVLACSDRQHARGAEGRRPGSRLAEFVTSGDKQTTPMGVLVNTLRGGGGAVDSVEWPDGDHDDGDKPRVGYVTPCGSSGVGLAILGPPGRWR